MSRVMTHCLTRRTHGVQARLEQLVSDFGSLKIKEDAPQEISQQVQTRRAHFVCTLTPVPSARSRDECAWVVAV